MIELRSIRLLPPFCFCVALLKLMTGSLKLSRKYLGMEVNNETGEVFRNFRNITTKKIDSAPDSCVFIVSFKFRHLSHQANKIASIIPMLLIAGFPGFIQKLYAYNPENGYWQGMYEWKSMKYLQAYQKSGSALASEDRAWLKNFIRYRARRGWVVPRPGCRHRHSYSQPGGVRGPV